VRLGERAGLVMVAAAALGVLPETFGLCAWLEIAGRSVLRAGIVVPNGLSNDDFGAIARWATAHPVETVAGPVPWRVQRVSAFFDPRAGIFAARTYSGAGWCIGADLGRVFGLMADHCAPRRGADAGSWELWMPGWGRPDRHGRWKPVSPHRRPLRLRAHRVGWMVFFAPCAAGYGKYLGGRQWHGAFIDVLALAYALDGDRGASFAEHRVNACLEPVELPVAVTVDPAGAERMTRAVHAVHELAVALDRGSAQWFTTAHDRAEGRGRLDLAKTVSAGALAGEILGRVGIRAPMETFGLSDTEHGTWTETFHGGWCVADRRFYGVPCPSVSLDVHSCFPLVAHLIDWWDLVCAAEIVPEPATGPFAALCTRVAAHPTVALDPAVWRHYGCALVELVPDVFPCPVDVEDNHRPDGRLEIVPVSSPGRPLALSALDVLAGCATSRQVPDIVRVVRFVASGRQEGLRRHVPVLPGLVLDTHEDPVLALVRHRHRARAQEDLVLAAVLRVVVNALVYGNFCRFDEILKRIDGTWQIAERPGSWNCMPIASSVTAGSHLLLALLGRLVADDGSTIAYGDTDSAILPATPAGEALVLRDGSELRSLSWTHVEAITAAFERLSPSPDWPVWEVVGRNQSRLLDAMTFSPKHHAEYWRPT
jgi:hypothetical protein